MQAQTWRSQQREPQAGCSRLARRRSGDRHAPTLVGPCCITSFRKACCVCCELCTHASCLLSPCRVGWSTQAASLDLGTDRHSFGFGGTGKKSHNRSFDSYGEVSGNT